MNDQTAAPADPMDMPLPCDVKVGHGTHRKGTPLRTLVKRMQLLYDMAQELAGASMREPAPATSGQPQGVGNADFEAWWSEHGQFCRAGGGDYEKTFAFRAWNAARDLDRQDWDRVHHALAKHGKHPGRTDDHLADVIDQALSAS